MLASVSSLWGGGFDINKLRPHLKMAVQRIGIAVNKKTASIKYVPPWSVERDRPMEHKK